MTGVADTRLLLALEFPPDEDSRNRVRALLQRELAGRLLAPSVIMAEYVKHAGPKIGKDSARTRIARLKEEGMRIVPLGEQEAFAAGELLLANHDAPMADALVASLVTSGRGQYVVSDDPHFRSMGVKSKWF
ncbi:MAG: PIN domain-containing protein [Nitrososphaerota archaeon]|nr:PIN domain-containing protein [Nitrososphaerota archaeon]